MNLQIESSGKVSVVTEIGATGFGKDFWSKDHEHDLILELKKSFQGF
jgi:hypothetical protein